MLLKEGQWQCGSASVLQLTGLFRLESFGWSHVSSCDKRYSELIIPNNERPLFR
jgi:hypothetical protein